MQSASRRTRWIGRICGSSAGVRRAAMLPDGLSGFACVEVRYAARQAQIEGEGHSEQPSGAPRWGGGGLSDVGRALGRDRRDRGHTARGRAAGQAIGQAAPGGGVSHRRRPGFCADQPLPASRRAALGRVHPRLCRHLPAAWLDHRSGERQGAGPRRGRRGTRRGRADRRPDFLWRPGPSAPPANGNSARRTRPAELIPSGAYPQRSLSPAQPIPSPGPPARPARRAARP